MEGPLAQVHPRLIQGFLGLWVSGSLHLDEQRSSTLWTQLAPCSPQGLLNLTEEKNDARVPSVTLARSLPALGTLEEWAEIPRKPPGQRDGYSRICPNSPGHAEVTARPGVRPSSSPSSLNTAGKTNTPRNPGDPGHVAGKRRSWRGEGGNTGSIFFQV